VDEEATVTADRTEQHPRDHVRSSHRHVHAGAVPGGGFAVPLADASQRDEIAPGVLLTPDQAVPMVPNIEVIPGEHSALVIDAGLGPVNGASVLAAAQEIAGARRLLLTTTHYHAEHAMGAQSFRGHASMVYNRAQRDELAEIGEQDAQCAGSIAPVVAQMLASVEFTMPDLVYEEALDIDLGGRIVQLRHYGSWDTACEQFALFREEAAKPAVAV
jgi:glyoxylase-like metal-dependent hydrolase (beta-lactamase superfamily II)